jgi:hypothetical protein
MLAAADLDVIIQEPPTAEYIRETTDSWNAGIALRNVLAPGIVDQVAVQSVIFIGLCVTLLLSNHQAIEEGAIALQGRA